MKKYYITFLLVIIIYSLLPAPKVQAELQENIISSQADSLGISTFSEDSE